MKSMLRKFTQSNSLFAIITFVVFFLVNIIVLPNILKPDNLISTIALLAPLIIVAMAATPSILSGGGGIDITMGPLIGFTNVALFTIVLSWKITNPALTIGTLLLFGAIIGTVSGLLVTVVRLQPIVATLGVSLILQGVNPYLMPAPHGTLDPWPWMRNLSTYVGPIPGPIIIMGAAFLLWFIITKLPYHKALLAVGGDDRAAFSSGINVTLVRTLAYTIGGFFAALAGIAFTAFVGSGDATIGGEYTMLSIAAAALGGTSLAGGRGGMFGSVFGALAIFFIQKLLMSLHVSNYIFTIIYGSILILALASNSLIRMSAGKRLGE